MRLGADNKFLADTKQNTEKNKQKCSFFVSVEKKNFTFSEATQADDGNFWTARKRK